MHASFLRGPTDVSCIASGTTMTLLAVIVYRTSASAARGESTPGLMSGHGVVQPGAGASSTQSATRGSLRERPHAEGRRCGCPSMRWLSLIHISEPTRQAEISYAVFCL